MSSRPPCAPGDREQEIPVALMKKETSSPSCARSSGGMFLLRTVEMIAASLMYRFTIYNYLNEIGEEDTPTRTAVRDAQRNDTTR